jgi:tetratricopeptide (TPR) repeat protein
MPRSQSYQKTGKRENIQQRTTTWLIVPSLILLWSSSLSLSAIAQSPQPAPDLQPGTTQLAPDLQPGTTQPAPDRQPGSTKPSAKPKPTEKQEQPDAFPPNPLDLREPDPLLPTTTSKRPLTAAEKKQLGVALDALNLQAAAKMKASDRIGALELWNREMRLRRALGALEETKALGRFGDAAWKDNNTPQVRWITDRLDKLLERSQSTKPLEPEYVGTITVEPTTDRGALLEALGLAYQQVRQPQTAIGIYQQILTDAKKQNDAVKVESTLITLGQLHLSWFDYPNAATTYQELLAIARAKHDQTNEILYLNQLAFIYEQAKEPTSAIAYQQQLVALYEKINDPKPIPGLKLKIADNYQRLSQLNLAEQNYQSAYQLAQTLLQLGYASDALQKLGLLYRANNRLPAAVRVYSFLVAVEQQAYNYYGIMSAYDQLGQIYITLKAYPQALKAFQQGLLVARQLKYRETYFSTQIQQVAKLSGK